MKLSNRHHKTLQALFDEPTRANIGWKDIEAMSKALGAEVKPKGGSVVEIRLSGHRLLVHRPHPQKEAYKGIVERIRYFLMERGIRP